MYIMKSLCLLQNTEIAARKADFSCSNGCSEMLKDIPTTEDAIYRKLGNFENQERRVNLVFCRLEDPTTSETSAQVEAMILHLCRTHFQLTSVDIEHAHEIGSYHGEKKKYTARNSQV